MQSGMNLVCELVLYKLSVRIHVMSEFFLPHVSGIMNWPFLFLVPFLMSVDVAVETTR